MRLFHVRAGLRALTGRNSSQREPNSDRRRRSRLFCCGRYAELRIFLLQRPSGFAKIQRRRAPVPVSLYHVIWEQPKAAVLKKGWETIQKAESMGAKTSREREYIAAVAAFSRDPEKPDYAARATAYSKVMEQLHNHYPKDGDAAAFYALSLLAAEPPQDTNLVNRKKAVAILQKHFAE